MIDSFVLGFLCVSRMGMSGSVVRCALARVSVYPLVAIFQARSVSGSAAIMCAAPSAAVSVSSFALGTKLSFDQKKTS